MADDDFDVQRLATYLHLTPDQVARLADRGKLPGRKVQGQWRFAQADVHHWLEQRIGLIGRRRIAADGKLFARGRWHIWNRRGRLPKCCRRRRSKCRWRRKREIR